jgi:hypothetical protein
VLTICRFEGQVPVCYCIRTTAGSNFCAEPFSDAGSVCADCQKDDDCEALGFPKGTACAPVSKGVCGAELECETGMACMLPCRAKSPVERRSA